MCVIKEIRNLLGHFVLDNSKCEMSLTVTLWSLNPFRRFRYTIVYVKLIIRNTVD